MVIYKNENLEEIGLSGLTKILRGGVRVSNNKKLCYAETVDWENIIDDASAKKSGILVGSNMGENFCADVCPNHCSKMKNGKTSCWNSRECQRKEVSVFNGIHSIIKTTEITSNKEHNTMFAIIAGSMSLGYGRKEEMLSS